MRWRDPGQSRLCEVAYDAARQVVRPGETEIEVYLAMNAAIVQAYGAPVVFPGDFACGGTIDSRRRAADQPNLSRSRSVPTGSVSCARAVLRRYMPDVSRRRTDRTQLESWELTCDAFALGESLIKPGAAGPGYLPGDQAVPRCTRDYGKEFLAPCRSRHRPAWPGSASNHPVHRGRIGARRTYSHSGAGRIYESETGRHSLGK